LRELRFIINFFTLIIIIFSFFFFFSRNFLILYIFFELVLFFILILIVGYGIQIEKINSSYYLIFYSIFCSYPFIFIYFSNRFFFSFCFFFFIRWEFFFFLRLCFLMKFPVYFLHIWLPKAHVEAPTRARILLAGLLLKLGTLGFFRIVKRINFLFLNFWFFISILGMIICSFICLFQRDSKSLAAYSSVTHMSFLFLSLIYFRNFRKIRGLIIILSHGYTSTLLFFFIGEFFHKINTRIIYFLNRLFNNSLIFCIILSFILLSNSGVPPSISFFSEFILFSCRFLFFKVIFFVVIFFFFFSFYYSFFFMVNITIGKFYVDQNFNSNLFRFSFLLMMFNFFWIRFFF